MSDDHLCPGPECTIRVPYEMLACGRHWRQVPLEAQRAVYRTWQHGRGAGTPEHAEAIREAVEHMRPVSK